MKTKFILNGGFTKGKSDEDNSQFYSEILKDVPEGAKVLLVCFAKENDRISDATTKVMAEFNKNKSQNKVNFEVANEQSFLEQIKSSEVIYLHGGRTIKLLEALKKFPNLKDLLNGKVIAGESAGANVLCQFFYSPTTDHIGEGLGFLPVKIIPHYSKEYEGKLDSVGSDLELLLLPEYQFKVF